jgi:hypothetical protein
MSIHRAWLSFLPAPTKSGRLQSSLPPIHRSIRKREAAEQAVREVWGLPPIGLNTHHISRCSSAMTWGQPPPHMNTVKPLQPGVQRHLHRLFHNE